MSVASHLGIELADYDARIRTFIPDYEQMLDVAAAALPKTTRTIVDLGVGTGALAARCLEAVPKARVFGIDVDPEILAMASRRLGKRATFAAGSFLRTQLPRCDAAVSSFALHHVRTRAAKRALYNRLHAALRPGGLLLSVDCQPAADQGVRRKQLADWVAHLRLAYSPTRAARLLDAWAGEDVYVPLEAEIDLLRRSGFRVEVLWRRGAFAVLRAAR
jgi:tRNA (cmo5U34)-methyltransferase